MIVNKPIDYPLLQAELTAAGVPYRGLGSTALGGGSQELYTFDAAGAVIDLPNGAAAVVAAHVSPPLPVNYTGLQAFDFATTTSGTPQKVLIRLPMSQLSAYLARVEVVGIDRANGTMKALVFWVAFKRLSNGGLGVGSKQDIFDRADTDAAAATSGVASWTIVPSIDANDGIVTVKGAAGRTVDWGGFVSFRKFRPAGVTE